MAFNLIHRIYEFYVIISEIYIDELTNEISYSRLFDKADTDIIETYPYFLAHPYKRALEEEDGFKRLHLLKEVFLNYLK